MQSSGPGLRERRRADMLDQLHAAAVDLVRRQGWSETTVDQIAQRVGASRRTFFNYYSSKEDAVLGTIGATIPEAELAAAINADPGSDRFTAVITLVQATLRSTRATSRFSTSERLGLLKSFPPLTDRTHQIVAEVEALLRPVVAQGFGDNTDSALAAEAMVLMAASVIKLAASINPRSLGTPDEETTRQAITAFREAASALELVPTAHAS